MSDARISRLPKWAQEHIAELERQARVRAALRWTEPVEPDVMPPGNYGTLAKGFLFHSYLGSERVEVACTSTTGHSFGSDDATTSQGPRRLFSSRLLALRALRHDVENQCARILAGIDQQIEQESE